MSQEQYNSLMSSLLKEKCALAKLREELEGRKRKLYRCCKGFGHLAQNCRKIKEEGKGTIVPQNKFEVLRSCVMQCGVEERVVRNMRMVVIRCFRCREEGYKYRECPLWIKRRNEKRVVCVVKPQKVQQEKRPAHPEKGKVQERERKLRRVEGEEVAHVARP